MNRHRNKALQKYLDREYSKLSREELFLIIEYYKDICKEVKQKQNGS